MHNALGPTYAAFAWASTLCSPAHVPRVPPPRLRKRSQSHLESLRVARARMKQSWLTVPITPAVRWKGSCSSDPGQPGILQNSTSTRRSSVASSIGDEQPEALTGEDAEH
eukprot:6263352-Amphidinium_carterae.3